MSKKVEIRLLASPQMTEQGEDKVVRFPLRARSFFGFSNSKAVVVGHSGGEELHLTIKQAYVRDVNKMMKMLKEGELTEDELLGVGFVSRRTLAAIKKDGEGTCWISSSPGHLTIGCDPEFGLVEMMGKAGILHRGDHVLPHSESKGFGADGPGVEVRPKATTDHNVLVDNIQSELEGAPVAARKFDWVGGASFSDANRIYWFGGHIHLGRPAAVGKQIARACYEKIATALDHMIALPMVSFDTPNPHFRRNGCPQRYGKAGDIRDDYPEENRFEYRVPSGLWLIHPTLAKVVLGTAKCVAETSYGKIVDTGCDMEYITGGLNRKHTLLSDLGLHGLREVGAVINNANPADLGPETRSYWENNLRNLDRYDAYKDEIEAFIAVAQEAPGNVVPQINLDIKRNWFDRPKFLPKASGALRLALDAVEEKE